MCLVAAPAAMPSRMPRPSSRCFQDEWLRRASGCTGDHVRVHHEPAGRNDDGFRPDRAHLGEVFPPHAGHDGFVAGVVDDQVRGAGLVADLTPSSAARLTRSSITRAAP